MEKILCVTNVTLDSPGGRAEALKTRVKTLERYGFTVDFFLIKKPYNSFNPVILHNFKKIVKKGEYRLVWSMNNPFTLHIPPLLLKMAGYDFKWLAEFRDPIYLNPDPKKFKIVYRLVEEKIFQKADAVVIIDGSQADTIDYVKEYGGDIVDKIHVLPYCGSDFNKCKDTEYEYGPLFKILYAGSFYKGWIEPITFFKGFRIFIDSYNIPPDRVQVNFFGDWKKEFSKIINELKLDDFIATHGWKRRSELEPFFRESNLFLHIAGSNEKNMKNISYKVWDYLCYAKPILALSDKDFDITEFILKNRFGYVAEYNNPREISKQLWKAFCEYGTEAVIKRVKKIIKNRKKFSRDIHDESFVRVCERLTERHN